MRGQRPSSKRRDPSSKRPDGPALGRRIGLARRISKLGVCSRSEAERRIRAGRVSVDGSVITDPEHATVDAGPAIAIDGVALAAVKRCCLMLNKPRGYTTSTADERGRQTVYACLDDPSLPWLAPVGRLDRASEGLLLFSNDPQWADTITAGLGGVLKTYRVRIDRVADENLIAVLKSGVEDRGEHLRVVEGRLLGDPDGQGRRWIELVLDQGKNRHIRRLLGALGVEVERLIRVAIGSLELGDIAKGDWRRLSESEIGALAQTGRSKD